MVRGITYEEGTNDGYEHVYIHYYQAGEDKEKLFDTGNFVKDWFDALKWYLTGDFPEHLANSSTVDHFIMDGAPYDSAYLKFKSDKTPYLDYAHDYFSGEDGIELFVPQGTQPTWEELKEMCK